MPTGEGWLYLAGVLDLGNRRLMGWAMGENLETSLPTDAWRMAWCQRRPSFGLVYHSAEEASTSARRTASIWRLGT